MRARFFPRKVKTKTSSELGLKHGFRSGLEDVNAKFLVDQGVDVHYEAHTLEYTQPIKRRRYTPDFILPNGIVIEAKGQFQTSDRQKHLMIQQDHPFLDLRFVFSQPHQRISKQSKTTYAMWCDHKGFLWAETIIPQEWIDEPPNKARLTACQRAFGWAPRPTKY